MRLFKTKIKDLIHSIYPLEINDRHDYFVIYHFDKVIGLFEIQPLTRITGVLHLHIKDEFQNQGLAIKAFNRLIEDLKNSPYKQLIGCIPSSNKRIMSIVNKTRGRCCGALKDAIIIDNALQDIILFQLEIK